jgi:hypothetical protein
MSASASPRTRTRETGIHRADKSHRGTRIHSHQAAVTADTFAVTSQSSATAATRAGPDAERDLRFAAEAAAPGLLSCFFR